MLELNKFKKYWYNVFSAYKNITEIYTEMGKNTEAEQAKQEQEKIIGGKQMLSFSIPAYKDGKKTNVWIYLKDENPEDSLKQEI